MTLNLQKLPKTKKTTKNDEKMHYKLAIFGACAPYPRKIYIEIHRLSRKETKITRHQNLGPGSDYQFFFKLRLESNYKVTKSSWMLDIGGSQG